MCVAKILPSCSPGQNERQERVCSNLGVNVSQKANEISNEQMIHPDLIWQSIKTEEEHVHSIKSQTAEIRHNYSHRTQCYHLGLKSVLQKEVEHQQCR